MRCPRCKSELSSGELRKYETLSDHVTNPNATDLPYRPSFICSRSGCLRGFFDKWGDYYSARDEQIERRYQQALDSGARKCEIEIKVIQPCISHKSKFFTYLKEVFELHIWGEKDIPQNILVLWWYFARAKYKHYKMLLTLTLPLKLGLKKYSFEKNESRVYVLKKRIKQYKEFHSFSRL